MDTPTWISRALVEAFHYTQLAEHGGSHGVRDSNALESALSRPRNRHAYHPDADLADLAAAYAFDLATSHPFVDGNKRTSFVAASVFLDLNGYEIGCTDEEVIEMMQNVAAGTLTEEEIAHRFRTSMSSRA